MDYGDVNMAGDIALKVAGEAQGDILYRNGSAWVRLPAGASGEFLKTLGVGANPVWAAAAGEATFKTGNFNHDMSTIGTQTITGIGFTPKFIMLMGCEASTVDACWGWTDGVFSQCMNNVNVGGEFNRQNYLFILNTNTGGGEHSNAQWTSFDADGFTITWFKGNSPTGTATLTYLAIK